MKSEAEQLDQKLDTLVKWVRETSKPVRGLLVPVSGGTDIALCFWICSQARPGEVLGVYTGEILRSKEWFNSLGKVMVVDTPGDLKEVEEMRWARFLAISIVREYGLVGSRTRTEDLLGTYSLASRVASFLPLVGTWKSEVLKLCAYVKVPNEVIASSFQPDCDCGRPPALISIPFNLIDNFLKKKALKEEADLYGLTKEQEDYL